MLWSSFGQWSVRPGKNVQRYFATAVAAVLVRLCLQSTTDFCGAPHLRLAEQHASPPSRFPGNLVGGVGMRTRRSGIPTRAFAANDNPGHACWTASRPRQALHIDGELPASTMRERAATVLAGVESGEPGPGTLRIVTPDLQERPIPDSATVEGLAAAPVVDSSAKSPREDVATPSVELAELVSVSHLASWSAANRRRLEARLLFPDSCSVQARAPRLPRFRRCR